VILALRLRIVFNFLMRSIKSKLTGLINPNYLSFFLDNCARIIFWFIIFNQIFSWYLLIKQCCHPYRHWTKHGPVISQTHIINTLHHLLVSLNQISCLFFKFLVINEPLKLTYFHRDSNIIFLQTLL
jgi:hypothetical protein